MRLKNGKSDLIKKPSLNYDCGSSPICPEDADYETTLKTNIDNSEESFLDENQTFNSVAKLKKKLTKSLIDLFGFKHPTHLQTKAIPLILLKKDVLLVARQGTGKTIAYAVAVSQILLKSQQFPLQCVVLAPSTDSCDQIFSIFKKLTSYCQSTLSIQKIERNIKYLAHETPAHIIVSTPKVFLEYIREKARCLDKEPTDVFQSSIIVLDSIDIMLAIGACPQLKSIFKIVKERSCQEKQVIVSAASISEEVKNIKPEILYKPIIIKLDDEITQSKGLLNNSNFLEYYVEASDNDSYLILYSLLILKLIPMKCVVVTNQIHTSYKLHLFLKAFSIFSDVLAESLPQFTISNTIRRFNQNLSQILIVSNELIKTEIENREVNINGDEICDDETLDKKNFDEKSKLQLHGVGCLIHFDIPESLSAFLAQYKIVKQLVSGAVSLTFLNPKSQDSQKVFNQIAQLKKNENVKFVNIGIDLSSIDCFRYRVNDVLNCISKKAVTKASIKHAQTEVLKDKNVKQYVKSSSSYESIINSAKLNTSSMTKDWQHLSQIPLYFQNNLSNVTTPTAIQEAIKKLNISKISRSKNLINSAQNFIPRGKKYSKALRKHHSLDAPLYKSPKYQQKKHRNLPKKKQFKKKKTNTK